MTEEKCDFLLSFFRGKKEQLFNKQVLDSKYDQELVCEYLQQLCSIPVEDYLAFIESKYHNKPIEAQDVLQFSKVENATDRLCEIMTSRDCEWISAKELGFLLLPSGKKRGENAYVRYGFDHLRLAEALGLALNHKKMYCLSAMGRAYLTIDDDLRGKLLTRLIIRTKLITRLYKEYLEHKDDDEKVEVELILYCLSPSTYLRRCPNIRGLFRVLRGSPEYSFEPFYQKLKF